MSLVHALLLASWVHPSLLTTLRLFALHASLALASQTLFWIPGLLASLPSLEIPSLEALMSFQHLCLWQVHLS